MLKLYIFISMPGLALYIFTLTIFKSWIIGLKKSQNKVVTNK